MSATSPGSHPVAKHVANSWMRSTFGQSSKRRKKAGSTANYFEAVLDETRETTIERLAVIRKIYDKSEASAQLPDIQYSRRL